MDEHVERRKDFSDLNLRLTLIERGFDEFAKVSQEYRDKTCKNWEELQIKINEIRLKLSELPCRERVYQTQSFNNQLKFLWGIMLVVVTAIIVEWVKK